MLTHLRILNIIAPSSPGIQLLDDRLKKVTVHFNTSFRLKLTGSPMPNMRCMLHNGEELIFCSLKDMKKVMYDNPSRPCNSSDLHYQIRSEKLQTADVGFHIINVTFARDNGSTIYCYWKYDNGTEKNISMQIVVIGKELFLLLLLSLKIINFLVVVVVVVVDFMIVKLYFRLFIVRLIHDLVLIIY